MDLAPVDTPPIQHGGRLARNIMHFARMLRRAGMRVGPGQTLDAVRAAGTVGVDRRSDFFWALHSVLVRRAEDRELFTEDVTRALRHRDVDRAFEALGRDVTTGREGRGSAPASPSSIAFGRDGSSAKARWSFW